MTDTPDDTTPASGTSRALLDPRYRWLMNAARRIYAQLDPDERMVVLTLLSGSADGEMIASQITYRGPVVRLLVPDESGALRQGEEFLSSSTINLTADDDHD